MAGLLDWKIELARCGWASTWDVVRGLGSVKEFARVYNPHLQMNLIASFPDKSEAQAYADKLNSEKKS